MNANRGVRRKFPWGGFIQWQMVVICVWCELFVMSQFDVIFMFQTNLLATFVDMYIFLHPLPLFYVSLHWISTTVLAFKVRISKVNALNATTQQFITAKISGCALKQGSKTYSPMRQRNLQLQNETAL